jgi:hypothetical protein
MNASRDCGVCGFHSKADIHLRGRVTVRRHVRAVIDLCDAHIWTGIYTTVRPSLSATYMFVELPDVRSCLSCIYFFYILVLRLVGWWWDWVHLVGQTLISLTVPTPGDRWVRNNWCNENWKRKPKYSECHYIHHKSRMTWPGIEPGPQPWHGHFTC